MRISFSNWKPNNLFCLSASRVSRRSAAAMASALVGFVSVMPRLSTGRLVSAATLMAMVFSISECGVMLACVI